MTDRPPEIRLPSDGRLRLAWIAALPALGAAWSCVGIADLAEFADRGIALGGVVMLLEELRVHHAPVLLGLLVSAVIAVGLALGRTAQTTCPPKLIVGAAVVGVLGAVPLWLVERACGLALLSDWDGLGTSRRFHAMLVAGAAVSVLIAASVVTTTFVSARAWSACPGSARQRGIALALSVLLLLGAALGFVVQAHRLLESARAALA